MRKQIRMAWGGLLAAALLASAALACTFQLGGSPRAPVGTPTWSLEFIAPENNSLVMLGTTLNLAVSATDHGGGVARIDFSVDGVLIGSQSAPIPEGQTRFSAQQTWQPREPRGYLITAEAFRADGSRIGEAGVVVQAVGALTAQAALQSTPVATQLPRPSTPTPLPTVETVDAPFTLNTPTPSPAAEPPFSPEAPRLRVTFDFLNVRARPDATSELIGRLSRGEEALIIGRNEARTWWVIERDGLRGWVINNPEWIAISGETAPVPLAASLEALPTATPSPAPPGGVAPTSTVAGTADLIILSATIVGGTPKVNQTFNVLITVRNQGTLDAPASLMEGVFQPDGERSQLAVPPIAAGTSVTLPPMPVTLRTRGTNLIGTLTLDIKNEVAEGANGEANNVYTLTYNVE